MLVGYIVWLDDPTTGIQLIMLSLTVMSLFAIGFMAWAGRKIRKLEQALKSIEGKG